MTTSAISSPAISRVPPPQAGGPAGSAVPTGGPVDRGSGGTDRVGHDHGGPGAEAHRHGSAQDHRHGGGDADRDGVGLGHATGHAPSGDLLRAHAHGSVIRAPALPWSLLRLSLAERLAIAAGLSAAIWGAVLWASMPVTG